MSVMIGRPNLSARREQHHLASIDGDGLGNVPFLSADARISARRVDEGDDGQTALVGQAHQPKRLPIALRVRRTEIAQDIFLCLAPFLRPDDHHLVVIQPRESADHGPIIGKKPVAVQFGEVAERHLQIVQRVGAFGMPGQLHPLPGGQIGKNLAPRFLDLFFDLPGFLLQTDAEGVGFGVFPQLLQLALQFHNRLLEIKVVFHSISTDV